LELLQNRKSYVLLIFILEVLALLQNRKSYDLLIFILVVLTLLQNRKSYVLLIFILGQLCSKDIHQDSLVLSSKMGFLWKMYLFFTIGPLKLIYELGVNGLLILLLHRGLFLNLIQQMDFLLLLIYWSIINEEFEVSHLLLLLLHWSLFINLIQQMDFLLLSIS